MNFIKEENNNLKQELKKNEFTFKNIKFELEACKIDSLFIDYYLLVYLKIIIKSLNNKFYNFISIRKSYSRLSYHFSLI